MTELAQIAGSALLNFSVAQYGELVSSTIAAIGETLVLAHGNPAQIIIAGGSGSATQVAHNAFPLRPMGLYPPRTIEAVDNIVGYFVDNRIAKTVLVVFGEQPGVVPYAPLFAPDLIHAGATPPEIKVYIHRLKGTAIEV
jgi:hypothetical protein